MLEFWGAITNLLHYPIIITALVLDLSDTYFLLQLIMTRIDFLKQFQVVLESFILYLQNNYDNNDLLK